MVFFVVCVCVCVCVFFFLVGLVGLYGLSGRILLGSYGFLKIGA